MRTNVLIIALILLVCSAGELIADRSVGSILLTANPDSIPADGKSVCTITAQVRDRQNNVVPNGTEVRFSTSLGIIEEAVITSAGAARAKLISGTTKGTAIITATWVDGQATTQMQVVFGGSTAPVAKGPGYISIKSDDYLAYSIDHKTMEAIGHVKIRYRSLDIEAYDVQIDLNKHKITARGNNHDLVKIHTNTGVIEGNMFFCVLGEKGILLSVDSGKSLQIDLSKGSPIVSAEKPVYFPEDFHFVDLSDSGTLIKAKEAIVFLDDKIQFTQAAVYVDAKRMFCLPYYIFPLNPGGLDGEQSISASTNGGISVNLPFYFGLTPESSAAVLVQHGVQAGWGLYGQTPGWSLGLREKYTTQNAQGTFELSQVTTPSDWGAHFTHSQQLDPDTHTYLFLDYPAHKDFFGNFSIDRRFTGWNAGLNLYGSMLSLGGDSMSADLYMQTQPKPIGKSPLRYTVSTKLVYTQSTAVPTDTTVTPTPIIGAPPAPPVPAVTSTMGGFQPSVQTNLYTLPYTLTKTLSFSPSVALGYLWGGEFAPTGMSTLGTASFDWKISKASGVSFGYRYAERASIYTAASVGTQSVTANWHYFSNKWQASLYGVKGLDYSSMNLFGNVSYKIDPLWRIGMRATLNEYGLLSYNDVEAEIGRMISGKELMFLWSKSQHRVLFQFGGGSF